VAGKIKQQLDPGRLTRIMVEYIIRCSKFDVGRSTFIFSMNSLQEFGKDVPVWMVKHQGSILLILSD
jgi:hypothetical protein